jgi:hypothetical protein
MGSGQALSNAKESKISINSILLLSDYNVAAHQRHIRGSRFQPLVRTLSHHMCRIAFGFRIPPKAEIAFRRQSGDD